jgi:hypothetical protein
MSHSCTPAHSPELAGVKEARGRRRPVRAASQPVARVFPHSVPFNALRYADSVLRLLALAADAHAPDPQWFRHLP